VRAELIKMTPTFVIDGNASAPVTILLAHGAGAPMDSASMNATSAALVGADFRVARFEFDYMAARRRGHRKPPPRAENLMPEYRVAIERLNAPGPLLIGGKSMGGRVASMVADDCYAAGQVAGLLCLGYPFHPPGKPQQLRTAHLADLKTPTLICQGTRDEFGTRDDVAAYDLSSAIDIFWLEDGDHDLKPRKTISGFTAADYLSALAARVRSWTGA
jgi:predicted alpha/beta-hydrolase family hydrolase